MNIEQVIQELEAEQSRIGNALDALKALRGTLGTSSPSRGKASGQPQRKKHTMSAAARRKISLAQKVRWAKVKKH